jgi:hypothetical protein
MAEQITEIAGVEGGELRWSAVWCNRCLVVAPMTRVTTKEKRLYSLNLYMEGSSHDITLRHSRSFLHYPILSGTILVSHHNLLRLLELADRTCLQVQVSPHKVRRCQRKPSAKHAIDPLQHVRRHTRHGLTVAKIDPDNDHS